MILDAMPRNGVIFSPQRRSGDAILPAGGEVIGKNGKLAPFLLLHRL